MARSGAGSEASGMRGRAAPVTKTRSRKMRTPGPASAVAPPIDAHLPTPHLVVGIEHAVERLAQELAAHPALPESDPQSARLRRMAENTTLLLRLLSGREPARPVPLDIGDLAMALLPAWQPRAPRHTFELALLGAIPPVVADADRVECAIDRLLAAVVNATPGGATVRVSVRPGRFHSDEVVVSVRHSDVAALAVCPGDGVFDPPGEAAPVDCQAPNAALDLTLARAMVEAHGGRVWSEESGGSATPSFALLTAWPLVPRTPHPPDPASALAAGAATSAATPGRGVVLVERERRVILLVEAEPRMARFIKANVEASGMRVVVAHDIATARRLADVEAPDLALLDGDLAGDERLEPLRHLIADCACPVLVLARKSDPLACARALDLGADDWIARPFSTEELLARIRARLRGHQPAASTEQEGTLTCGDLTIDVARRRVTVAGRAVALTRTEYKLLHVLARHPGAVLAHDMLLERVWGPGYADAVEFVWVYVRRLRRKIELDPAHPRFILTVPGVGYRLASS